MCRQLGEEGSEPVPFRVMIPAGSGPTELAVVTGPVGAGAPPTPAAMRVRHLLGRLRLGPRQALHHPAQWASAWWHSGRDLSGA